MRMKNFLSIVLCLGFLFSHLNSQNIDARNGWGLAPYGHFHVLLIFAEIEYDSAYSKLDPCPTEGSENWKKGELPKWKDKLFYPKPEMTGTDAFMSNYFRQASFNRFQVTGDYVEKTITLKQSEIRDAKENVVTSESFANNYFKKALLDKLNASEIRTANQMKFEDFDRWALAPAGIKKEEKPNGNWDMVMIIWRNINVYGLGDNSGFVSPGSLGELQEHQMDSYSMFRMSYDQPTVIIRHEFSHMLYGGNNFHTADAGAGTWTYFVVTQGYSNMSNADRSSETWNAWDRERMNWKNPDNQFLMSARDGETNKEVSGELTYGTPLSNENGIYMLRDFVRYGDALKIKLPYVPEKNLQEYLWIENHQLLPGSLDHHGAMPKGMYAFITSGKDKMTGPETYGGDNCYTWFLTAEGNYDFRYEEPKPNFRKVIMDADRENPLTGYSYLTTAKIDRDSNGRIEPMERVFIENLRIRGEEMPDSYFTYLHLPMYGTAGIGFTGQNSSKICMGCNPSANSVLTHSSAGGMKPNDNRKIWLNGISIEIMRFDQEGNCYVKIRWDDFDISSDIRWCGDIVCNEQINILPKKTLFLDQGYSPQELISQGKINGEHVFAKPTVLTLIPGSTLTLGKKSKLIIGEGSKLIVQKGAIVNEGKKSKIEGEVVWE